MQLTIFNIIKTLFAGSSQTSSQAKFLDDEDHAYIRGDIENRGPCPGLNALANQGYLYSPPVLCIMDVDILTSNHTTRRQEYDPFPS